MLETVVQSPFLTYKEAADFCRCDRSTLWRAMKAGRLKSSGPGTRVVFHRDELIRWMDSKDQ